MICPECGSHFSLVFKNVKDYVYKTNNGSGNIVFCSYHCYNAYLNRKEARIAERRRKHENS